MRFCYTSYQTWAKKMTSCLKSVDCYQFQMEDDLKAPGNEAARLTEEYLDQSKTSQRREILDRELALWFSAGNCPHLMAGGSA